MGPVVVCPRCHNTFGPRLLESSSKVSEVLYYRCHECSHVWAVDKADPKNVHHVTPFDRRKQHES